MEACSGKRTGRGVKGSKAGAKIHGAEAGAKTCGAKVPATSRPWLIIPTGPVKPPPSDSGLPDWFDRKPVETG